MVRGIDKFKAAFNDYTDHFIIIGGTACDTIMSNAGMDYRVTKDLDIVLIVESIKADFFRIFWEFVRKANYKNREKSDGKKQFYRFAKPKDQTYPYMLELFSRQLDSYSMPDDSFLTPIPTDESIISLSAILLDDDYYDFIKSHRIKIEDLPIITEECLIPMKAKAWMDLTERKNRGEKVKTADIKKHKNDIVRLCQLLPVESSIKLPSSIEKDMKKFIKKYRESAIHPNNLKVKMKPEDVFEKLTYYFGLC